MKEFLRYLVLASISLNGQTAVSQSATDPMVTFLKEYLSIKYGYAEFDQFVYVAAKRQRLYLIAQDKITETYIISSAKNGIGNLQGSFQTPEGLHKIAEKIGDGLPLNTVIKQKIPTQNIAETVADPVSTDLDYITTRILHLRGEEEGINSGARQDSYLRGIFIHGTHEEGLLGNAASKGCIRMANKDVVDLFDHVEVGTFVIILNN